MYLNISRDRTQRPNEGEGEKKSDEVYHQPEQPLAVIKSNRERKREREESYNQQHHLSLMGRRAGVGDDMVASLTANVDDYDQSTMGRL